ncbi:Hypothetical predicted protein, partial [Pelobates cultripes]
GPGSDHLDTGTPTLKHMQALKDLSMSTEAYEQRIQKLEKQRAEVAEMKLASCQQNAEKNLPHVEKKENILEKDKIFLYSRYHDALIAQLQETKEENQLLRKQNALFNRKTENYENEISRLNKALLEAMHKENSQKTQVFLNPSVTNVDYGDMVTQVEVLKLQLQIYEEDFKRERADRERLIEEKDTLLETNKKLQTQLSKTSNKMWPKYSTPIYASSETGTATMTCALRAARGIYKMFMMGTDSQISSRGSKRNSPRSYNNYQWYVPGQLPPDVRQKENGDRGSLSGPF